MRLQMRRHLLFGFVFLVVVMLVLPTVMGRLSAQPVTHPVAVEGADSLPIKVYFPATQTVESLPLGEYLKGVVAAEMPSSFATEALKAQFIVARTYAVHRMRRFAGSMKGGCPDNLEADICADPKTGQAYISEEEAVDKWGFFAASSLWHRLDEVQAATEGLVLRYGGELIDPLYHSVSGTTTEAAEDYFAHALPYLKPADDHWGANAPGLKQTVQFTPEQLAARLNGISNTVAVAAVAGAVQAGRAPVEVTSRTASDRAKTVKVAGITLSGREFREKLGLRSTAFTVKVEQGKVVITTTGYGHGVGMSQYGADGMARAGKSYKEILTHYYQGITIEPLFTE
ncbi:MAG: stage II sporulation protein D [Mycobacterium leprae]